MLSTLDKYVIIHERRFMIAENIKKILKELPPGVELEAEKVFMWVSKRLALRK